jgi:DHA2 family multidrug resistance protein-like MFS transporter
MAAIVATVLAGSGVNVLLPIIALDLGQSAGVATWVAQSFLFGCSVCLLPAAALGDQLGHAKVFRFGLVVFVAGCLGSACVEFTPAPLPALLVARFAQGAGAAAVMAVTLALLRAIHPVHALGTVIGLNAVAVAASNAAGPAVAGGAVLLLGWQGVLLLFGTPAALALVLARGVLPRHAVPATGSFDALSGMLQAGAIGGFVLASALDGFAASALLALGAIAGLAFVVREKRSGFVMLPLDMMRKPLFAASFVAGNACFIAQASALVAVPFMLQARGFAPAYAGLAQAAWPLAVMLGAPLAGFLSDRVDARWLTFPGLLLAAGALLGLGMGSATMTLHLAALCLAGAGLGFALFTGPNSRALVLCAPEDRTGAVGGLQACARQFGQLLGSMVAGWCLTQAPASVASGRVLVIASVAALGAALASLFRRQSA